MSAGPNVIAQSFRRYWPEPQTRVGRIALWIAVFVLGCVLLRLGLARNAMGGFFGALAGLGLLALTPFALILAIRSLNSRLLWRVRNRLIVTYVLMGLAPVVLFATLTAIAGYIFAGQFSINAALAGMDEAADQVKSEASEIGGVLTLPGARSPGQPLQFEQQGNPREMEISVATLQNGVWKNLPLLTARGSSPKSPFDGVVSPAWLHTGYRGVLVWQGKLYLCRVAGVTEDQRSAQVLAALELNRATLTSIGHSLGRVLLFSGNTGQHRVEMDDAEREAQTAEQQADLAENQRELQQQLAEAQRDRAQAQRDQQQALREAQRDQQQAQQEAAAEVREAQRDVDRANAEAARLLSRGNASPEDQSEAQEELKQAQRALSEAVGASQAEQAAPAPAAPVPPPAPTVKVPSAPHRPLRPAEPNAPRSPVTGGEAPPVSVPYQQPHSSSDGGFAAVSGGVVPTPASFFNPRVYFTAPFQVLQWQDGRQSPAVLVVISRPSALYARLFSTSVEMGSVLRNVLVAIAIGFAFLELIALWMASRLSGTITHSVADLYQGTTEIDKGNLNYRVRPQRQDQLGALAGSFNRMAGSIQDLLVQQRKSDRLLNELAIAQEVQQTLFPHSPVSLARLELHAVCLPARTVSGDYFDFIFAHNTLSRGTAACIALGDISGKGISAALLMATLHSAVRAFSLREGEMPSPARQLELLNEHLFASTQSNRYATLFLAFYDARSRTLTYANGGHLPPFLISAEGAVRRLDVGGSVVGLLENLHYQEATVELKPGDLLVAFTDGVTEPENRAEQDFGEARLLSLLQKHGGQPLPELADAVTEAVQAWIAGQEQPDDMTLLLARQR